MALFYSWIFWSLLLLSFVYIMCSDIFWPLSVLASLFPFSFFLFFCFVIWPGDCASLLRRSHIQFPHPRSSRQKQLYSSDLFFLIAIFFFHLTSNVLCGWSDRRMDDFNYHVGIRILSFNRFSFFFWFFVEMKRKEIKREENNSAGWFKKYLFLFLLFLFSLLCFVSHYMNSFLFCFVFFHHPHPFFSFWSSNAAIPTSPLEV